MGVTLTCDVHKGPILSGVPLIMSHNPTAIGGVICLKCLRSRMDRLETAIEEPKDE